MSLISYASFTLSCAKFIQQQQTNSILNEINNNLVLLRDRNVKAGISIMNDAQNCRNPNNLEFYIKSAYLKFVEAIQSYSIDREFGKLMDSSLKQTLSSSLDEKDKESERVLIYYQSACLGAGICSYYLGEYKNCFKYIDASLYSATRVKSILEGINSVQNLFSTGYFSFKIPDYMISSAIINFCKDSFDCFIDLEGKNETYSKYPNSNLAKLKDLYNEYKYNHRN